MPPLSYYEAAARVSEFPWSGVEADGVTIHLSCSVREPAHGVQRRALPKQPSPISCTTW